MTALDTRSETPTEMSERHCAERYALEAKHNSEQDTVDGKYQLVSTSLQDRLQ